MAPASSFGLPPAFPPSGKLRSLPPGPITTTMGGWTCLWRLIVRSQPAPQRRRRAVDRDPFGPRASRPAGARGPTTTTTATSTCSSLRGQSTTTTNLLLRQQRRRHLHPGHPRQPWPMTGVRAGSAWADYDNNGFQDLFVTSHAGFPEVLYRNHGNGNHWISFKLVGTRSNRSAIGAKVRVRATIFGKTYWQMREIGGGKPPSKRSAPALRPGRRRPRHHRPRSNGPRAPSRSSRTSRATSSTPSSSRRCGER
jgi:hypothetical protein